MKDLTKNIFIWVAIAVALLMIVQTFNGKTAAPEPMAYSQFLAEVKKLEDTARQYQSEVS